MNPKKIIRTLVPAALVRGLEGVYRGSRGLFWQVFYGFPTKGVKVIAVTGTNGKTTTSSYINSVLQAGGLKTAVYTTAYYEIGGKRVPNRTHMTVTSQKSVQAFFAKAKKAKVDYVILEVTSHALEQKRIKGVNVEVAVMTNLTQDHLDYHGTMENYAAAKARLFSPEYSPEHAILNVDDDWYDFFLARSDSPKINYGQRKDASLRLKQFTLKPTGTKFTVHFKEHEMHLETRLIGLFNVYNALAAASVGLALGLKHQDIKKGIAALDVVPGRMEQIEVGQDFAVLVDFAYTADALQNVLTTIRNVSRGRVAIVFGATGDRDKTKRGPMGEVVAKLADRIYLTDDETYTEDPEAIRQAVYAGIAAARGQGKTRVFDDRLKAIQQAFKDARKGDTVLLAGIGHEDYRNMGGKKLPWDERDIARTELSQLTK